MDFGYVSDKGGETGMILINRSKAFNHINLSLLIAKPNAYRFVKSTTGFICFYHTKRKQMTKIGSSYNFWKNSLSLVTRESEWLSVRLRTKWFLVRVPLQSLFSVSISVIFFSKHQISLTLRDKQK